MSFKHACKRVMTTALAATLAASTMVGVTGCGSSGNTTKSKDLIQLDVLSTRANYAGIQGGWMGEVYAEKFGVQLNIIKGDETTLAVMQQSGDMGDIIVWGAGGDTFKKCASQGLLIDWESGTLLDEHGAYIKENCQADLENMRNYVDDGKIYGLCGDVSSSADGIDTFFYNWDIRWDLYEACGCPEIKDLDDLYDLFVQMKEICPTNDDGQETYAMSLWPDWDGDMVMYAKCLAQAYYGLEGDYVPGLYDNEDGTYYDILDDDGPFLTMVRFLNKLYRAGLLDPNSNVNTYDDAISKLKNDRVFFSIFNYAGSTAYNTADHLAAGKAMFSLVPEDANTIVYALSETGVSSMNFSIGAKSEYPDVAMDIINWMFTPEGRLTTEYGPEGLCWYYGDDGKTYFTAIGEAMHNDQSLPFGDLYKYTDGEGKEHIVAANSVTDNKYTDDAGVTYDATLYYELPEEYSAYEGMVFQDGTNEMNIVSWNVNTINPETGERYNCDYWESTLASAAASDIEKEWREWATEQAGYEVYDSEGYLQSTDYDIYLTVHDAADALDTDSKIVYKQITGSKDGLVCTGCWNAILASTEEECEKYISDMRASIMNFGADGTTCSYDDLVEFWKGQCDTRYSIEQEFIAAHPGVFD